MSIYKTARGKTVDMSTMATKHEKTRAVGNMNVNARGDVIDPHNKIVRDSTNRINTTYNKTVTTNTAPNSPSRAPIEADSTIDKSQLTPEELEFEQDDDEEIKK
jgi:hypothetical protein